MGCWSILKTKILTASIKSVFGATKGRRGSADVVIEFVHPHFIGIGKTKALQDRKHAYHYSANLLPKDRISHNRFYGFFLLFVFIREMIGIPLMTCLSSL